MTTPRPAGRGLRSKALYINDPVQTGKYAASLKLLRDHPILRTTVASVKALTVMLSSSRALSVSAW